MPMIRYKSRNYPSNSGPGYWSLNPDYYYVTWPDIVHSALTVGRAKWLHVYWHGIYSYFEMIYRSAITFANLKSYGDQTILLRTDAYRNLDRSEKSAISYFLGLTFAKLLADHFLSTPWLMHLDVYNAEFPVELWKGEKRPDLIGRNLKRDWIVMEAKGRSGNYDKKAFSDAKSQTRNVKKIEGIYPATRVASEIYFPTEGLAVHIEDPPEFNDNAPDLDISETGFLLDYYRPFADLVHARGANPVVESVGNADFYIVDINEANIRIGLAANILPMIEHRNFESIYDLSPDGFHSTNLPKRSKLGRDGILIELGKTWDEREMAKEPESRWQEHVVGPERG